MAARHEGAKNMCSRPVKRRRESARADKESAFPSPGNAARRSQVRVSNRFGGQIVRCGLGSPVTFRKASEYATSKAVYLKNSLSVSAG